MLGTLQNRSFLQGSATQPLSGGFPMSAVSSQSSLFGAVSSATQSTAQQGTVFSQTQPLGFGSTTSLSRQMPQSFGSAAFGTTQASSSAFNQSQPIAGFPSLGQQLTGLPSQSSSSLSFMSSTPQQSQLSFTSPFSTSLQSTQLSSGNLSATTSWATGSTTQTLNGNKDDHIPQGLATMVQGFKSFVSSQKSYSAEVARAELKPIVKISDDIDIIVRTFVIKLKRMVAHNNRRNIKLKSDTINSLSDGELAQGILDLSNISSDNNSTLIDSFFTRLAERYKEQVSSFKMQLENTEKHLIHVMNPSALTPQEFYTLMLRQHDSFVALAGRLQFIHSSIARLKQKQNDVRRRKLGRFGSLDDRKSSYREKVASSLLPVPGPTPFSGQRNYHIINMMANKAKMLQSLSKSELSLPGSEEIINVISFQNSVSPMNRGTNPNFLLKPPPGNKRGKR